LGKGNSLALLLVAGKVGEYSCDTVNSNGTEGQASSSGLPEDHK